MQGLAGGLCHRREWEQVLGLHFQVLGYTSTGDDYTSRLHPPGAHQQVWTRAPPLS